MTKILPIALALVLGCSVGPKPGTPEWEEMRTASYEAEGPEVFAAFAEAFMDQGILIDAMDGDRLVLVGTKHVDKIISEYDLRYSVLIQESMWYTRAKLTIDYVKDNRREEWNIPEDYTDLFEAVPIERAKPVRF